MEETFDFLLVDKNILNAEIVDVVDKNEKFTVGLSITVGMNDDQITSLLELVGSEIFSKIPAAFEIILTKNDLKKINKLVREYE